MHLFKVKPVHESHPSGYLVIAAVSMKYFGMASMQSAKVFPKQVLQLVRHGEMAAMGVVFVN